MLSGSDKNENPSDKTTKINRGKMNTTLTTATQKKEITAPPQTKRHYLLWSIYLVSCAVIIWFLIHGEAYYLTPYAQRPHHPDYQALRPAGSIGLIFGITGAAMMVLMLIYTVRKRTRLLGRWLSLRQFLHFHIYLGIIGPLRIVLHTSFKVQGLVAVSFWSMVAVALSGFFGRYLYSQIPRNIEGDELTLQEIDHISEYLAGELRDKYALEEADLKKVEEVLDDSAKTSSGTFASVMNLIKDDIIRPFSKRRLRMRLARILRLPKAQFNHFLETSFERIQLKRRIAMMDQVRQLFYYWHVVHKPFAIIMYIIMCIHIGVAIWTGYAWIH
jgi:hypothetical protein